MANVWFLQGRGTGANAANTNGGAYDPAAGGSPAWTTSQAANGGPIDACVDAAIVDGGATDTITKAGEFTATLVGHWAYISSATQAANTRVKVTARTDNTITFATVDWADPVDVVVNVGGALDNEDVGLQIAFDGVAAGDSIKAAPATYIIDATDTIDAAGTGVTGTAGAHITVEGVNATTGERLGVGDTRPIFQCPNGTALASGLIHISGIITYYDWFYLDFDGSSDGSAGDAEYCIEAYDTAVDFHAFYRCRFHNADSHGIYSRMGGVAFVECEFDANGLGGTGSGHFGNANGENSFIGCTFHDNATSGILHDGASSLLKKCNAYDNGAFGFDIENSSTLTTVDNCSAYDNDSGGIRVDAANTGIKFINNFSWQPTTGQSEAYVLDSVETQFVFFSNNYGWHFDADNICSEVADAVWAAYKNGNNIVGAGAIGAVITVGGANPNFIPVNGSPLLGAGVPEYFSQNGDLDAIENFGHIGAATRKEPANQLINGGLIS